MGIGNAGQSEWMTYAGLAIPVSAHISVEPLFFINQTSPGALEQRLMLNSKVRLPQQIELDAGFMYGRSKGEAGVVPANIFGVNMIGQIPVGQQLRLQFLYRYELTPVQHFSVLALGARVRIE